MIWLHEFRTGIMRTGFEEGAKFIQEAYVEFQKDLEQHIRASRAQELGLLSMLNYDDEGDPQKMATALCQLIQQNRPSKIILPGLLDGLENINRLAGQNLAKARQSNIAVAVN